MYCGVCNVPHDRPTLSAGAGSLMVWASALEKVVGSSPAPAHSPIFSVEAPVCLYLLCCICCEGVDLCCLYKFNCNILGWKTVPFIFSLQIGS